MSWSNFTQRSGFGRPLAGRESVVHSRSWTVVHRPLGVNFRWNSAPSRRRPQRGDDARPHPVDAAREPTASGQPVQDDTRNRYKPPMRLSEIRRRVAFCSGVSRVLVAARRAPITSLMSVYACFAKRWIDGAS